MRLRHHLSERVNHVSTPDRRIVSEGAHAQLIEVWLRDQTDLVTMVVLHEFIGISRGDERLNGNDSAVLIFSQGRVVNSNVPQV